MGMYVEHTTTGAGWPSPKGKADVLLADGAVEIPESEVRWQPFLICVVENPVFDAAAFIYSAKEYMISRYDDSDRARRWLVSEAICRANFGADTIAEHLADVRDTPNPEAVFRVVHRSREDIKREAEAMGMFVYFLD